MLDYNPGHNILELCNILVQTDSSQVNGKLISNTANLVYELPHELPKFEWIHSLGLSLRSRT